MAEQISTSVPPGARHKRHLRNYLLDPSFQLKYANFVAAIALVLGGTLGFLLWQTSAEMVDQSKKAVALGNNVIDESLKVSEVVRMNIVKDPIYSENPVLQDAFEADAKEQDAKLREGQAELRAQAVALETQSAHYSRLLIAALGVLVIALWLAGIVITHKVAGPVYKMKRQIRDLQKGNFKVPSPLRKGDELKSFFDAFNDMVESLRARQRDEIEQIDATLEALEKDVAEEKLVSLRAVRAEMAASLDP
jgi:nitrogen fixation/metabolism regulation signal transduction histidine kinase